MRHRLRQDDQAVSPVIGVILMVAITVVLAAVVFVLVSELASEKREAPAAIGFSKDEANDRIDVARAEADLDWSQLEIRSAALVAGLVYDRNAAAGLGDTAVTSVPTALSAKSLDGGDYLEFCATLPASDVEILLLHPASNAVVYRATFTSVAAC